jgi:tuberous sclerosis 2
MSPQIDDGNRPTRQRSNTTFAPFNWRRGKTDVTVPQQADAATPLSLEALIEALTPPAVPSITHARALAVSLSNQAPAPRIAIINPILAALCTSESPLSLQAAGYDILAAYWDNGSTTCTTADRLACFSLFPEISTGWSGDLWEPRFKALVALIRSGSETVGLESSLIKMLRDWIEAAFVGLAVDDEPLSTEERVERQRSVETMIGFLLSLLGRPEFVSRVTETDTHGVLELFGGLIEKALFSSSNNSPVASPQPEVAITSPNNGSGRLPPKHHRHHSSLSIPQVLAQKTAGDFIVEAYLRYLDIRLKAIAPVHLKTILPQLFRTLAYYETPLPRLSLTQESPYQHATEANIMEKLDSLVTGPYSASCTVILRYHLFPEDADIIGSMRTSLGALRTLRASVRRVLITRLARSYISRTSSLNYTPSGAPGAFDIPHDLVERAWAREGDLSTWDLNRFRGVLCRCIKAWVETQQTVESSSSASSSHLADTILNEIAGMLKDITQAFDQTGDELDYEEIEAVGDVLHELTSYIRTQRYVKPERMII